MSTTQDIDELQSDDGYKLAMEHIDASSPEAKMVGEELDAFLSRLREKLNEINGESVSLDELSKTIIKLVASRLGNPTARTIMTAKRSPNVWNLYLRDNYENVKTGMHGISLFPNIPSDSSIAEASRDEVIKEVLKRYKNRPTGDEIDGSMTSSRLNTPSPVGNTSSRIGDTLIPVRGQSFKVERRKHWSELRRIVNP